MYKTRDEKGKEVGKVEIEKVKCDKCKHYVDKQDAQKIKVLGGWGNECKYFCPTDSVPYDEITMEYKEIKKTNHYPYAEYKIIKRYYKNARIEVTESGKEIKKKKNARI